MPWRLQAHKGQLSPDGDWRTWYIRGGRGSGKTRAGAEVMAEWIKAYPGYDWAIVAPTFSDARDTCVEGESGLLPALGLERAHKGWNRSQGILFLPSGGRVFCDGADDGALRIQGRNLAGLWADEVGLWRKWRLAWDESIAFAVRIDPAKIIATGTPKRGHGLVLKLIEDASIPKTVLRTWDNRANLSKVALSDLLKRFAGRTLGRQELEGEILGDVEGAQWKRDWIRYDRGPLHGVAGELVPDYVRVVIAVDPAVTYGPDSDETGIIVAGMGPDGRGYVIEDLSGRFSSGDSARRIIGAYALYEADLVVGEVNNGGDLVESNLRAHHFAGAFKAVHATRGKRIRAEPISGHYEAGEVSHLRPFVELEDQLCTFTFTEPTSPDRLDALVWAFTELFTTEDGGEQFSMIA